MTDAAHIQPWKRRGMGDFKLPRRVWSVKEEEGLIVALKDVVKQGWKCENGFRTRYLGVQEQEMKKLFPSSDIKADPHIQSKIHVWKKTYGSLVGMLGRSGFGWNDATNMVVVDDDVVWDNYIKIDPFAKSMRLKSFPFYLAWCEVFGKDRAMGEYAKDIANATKPCSDADKCKTSDYYIPTMGSPNNNAFFADDDFISSFYPMGTDVQNDESSSKIGSGKKRKKGLTDLDARYIESIDRFVDRAHMSLPDDEKAELNHMMFDGSF
ncbi:UNVERIFIED_CONTAM: hypothetical protein Sradi_5234100 [Sesamum radiatum]|uniref:Myb/SANT-like domain-containing protein n=1 Tax=Sesamum radiatum TaxID=300843 RepID=A0AAW2LL35_SESRA